MREIKNYKLGTVNLILCEYDKFVAFPQLIDDMAAKIKGMFFTEI
jgi:hypothetical protein